MKMEKYERNQGEEGTWIDRLEPLLGRISAHVGSTFQTFKTQTLWLARIRLKRFVQRTDINMTLREWYTV